MSKSGWGGGIALPSATPRRFSVRCAHIRRTSFYNPPLQAYKKTRAKPSLFVWLGIKNDYRTLIGVDSLDIIEKEEDDDSEENSDV